ncbi:tRNA pseudouridine(55) synthase TruB [Patescibacteria group bacterium]|nr:tRNA pseudouridine(55) synthase TruB [Patescibacteria group bacterium]
MMEINNEKFVLIDKPVGWTSHDVISRLRKKYGIKKIGHSGTLDPFATGLLIVGVGRDATKRLDEFKKMPKVYVATIHLGAVSDTHDKMGKIELTMSNEQLTNLPSRNDVEDVLKRFVGKQLQTPPMYSAKKIQGKKLYELAREGITVERKPAEIEIYDIKLLEYDWPYIKIEVKCSTGTYIRALAHDIGAKLGCGGYCEELRRTKIGEYNIDNAETIS